MYSQIIISQMPTLNNSTTQAQLSMEDSDMFLANCQVSNFKIVRQIGSGSYGLVFHVTDLFSNANFAMKIILKSHLFNTLPANIKKRDILLNQLIHELSTHNYKLHLPTVDLDSIVNITEYQLEANPQYKELQLHLKVHQHPNIVSIHQVLESHFATFIIMDYYPTDLFTSIVDDKHFSQDGALVKRAMIQLSSVLEYCALQDVYHCDLKPENILLDKFDNLYLCDFGLATTSSSLLSVQSNIEIGSSYYMAPERITNNHTHKHHPHLPCNPDETIKGDIWSLGILLINLTCIRNPWAKASIDEDKTFAYFINNPSILQKILPISNELLSLLLRILVLNPADRISYEQIKHEIINIQSFTQEGPLSKVDVLEQSSLQHSISTGTILNSALPSTTTLTALTNNNNNNNLKSNAQVQVCLDDTFEKDNFSDYSRTATPCNSDSFFKNYQTNTNANASTTTDQDNSLIRYDNDLKDTLLSYQVNLANHQSSNDFLQF